MLQSNMKDGFEHDFLPVHCAIGKKCFTTLSAEGEEGNVWMMALKGLDSITNSCFTSRAVRSPPFDNYLRSHSI